MCWLLCWRGRLGRMNGCRGLRWNSDLQGASVNNRALKRKEQPTQTSIASGFEQMEDLLVVQMLQPVDVVDDLGGELDTGQTGRRAFGHGAQRGGALQRAARALEALVQLRRGMLQKMKLVCLHIHCDVSEQARLMPEKLQLTGPSGKINGPEKGWSRRQ